MNITERARPNWDQYGMMLAYTAAERSPDPHIAVGAAAFRIDRSTASTGYNGALPGVEIDWSDRDARRPHVIHAEYNCLKYTKPGEIYYIYVTMLPCGDCFNMLYSHGVKEIIYDQIYSRDSSALVKALEMGVNIRQLSLSYEIFKKHK